MNVDPMLGHNLPPALKENLEGQHAELFGRANDLMEAVERAPKKIDDDETQAKVADLVLLLQKCIKAGKEAHKKEKAPYLDGGRIVDATFKQATDVLDQAKKLLERRMSDYAGRKAAAERRAAEEEARKRREEAEKAAAAL